MRNFFTILLGIICIIVLFLGHSNWNKKIAASAKNTSVPSTTLVNPTTETEKNTDNEMNATKLITLTKNWPPKAVEQFQQALKVKKSYKILFVGSPAIGSETAGTYQNVKEKLIAAFGKNTIQVVLKIYDSTSSQFVTSNKQEEVAAEDADLIVLEPFILVNNGKVKIDDSLKDVSKMMEAIKAKKPETSFILQPSFPLYKAKFYPLQVAELKKYAANNHIAYLDHWSAWPDTNSEKFKDYLLPDQSAPSEKGNQVWSDYLVKYLISE
ncbi:SGNH/GDSL hydrolase family protein [Neobacillus ginsengisoli]|uniref:SGNH/GDSL hydrolase family protein n=1 Tax=Neobacillus ginsengisoli TaxID=904295 RepID=A0ABT9XZ51_9BACI|nr:SGNH/GDSL hydrolase family protein [Neobacillus ginsengisoli]MDQ0200756.1 hypothetical protein [Neobacillus ginsengisoli]